MQQTLFDFDDEGIPNPFYDPYAAEREHLMEIEFEKEAQRKRDEKLKAEEGLEYQICCAHVSLVDGSAYAVKVLDGYPAKYVVYSGGLPKGVEANRCDCEGKSDGWRGGKWVNCMHDKDAAQRAVAGK